MGTGREVDRDPLAVGRQRERGGLAGVAHELLEQRPCEVAQVEARERGIAEVDEPETELPALSAGLALHEARLEQRREHARDGARVDLRAP